MKPAELETIRDLVERRVPVDQAAAAVAAALKARRPHSTPLLVVTRAHVRHALDAFSGQAMTAEELRMWATAMRGLIGPVDAKRPLVGFESGYKGHVGGVIWDVASDRDYPYPRATILRYSRLLDRAPRYWIEATSPEAEPRFRVLSIGA